MTLVDIEMCTVIRLFHRVHYIQGCADAPSEVRVKYLIVIISHQLVPILEQHSCSETLLLEEYLLKHVGFLKNEGQEPVIISMHFNGVL